MEKLYSYGLMANVENENTQAAEKIRLEDLIAPQSLKAIKVCKDRCLAIYKIISVKTGKVLNDLHEGSKDNFDLNIKNAFDNELPHRLTFHTDDGQYLRDRLFKLKPSAGTNSYQIITFYNGYKLAEAKESHYNKFNFFLAVFSESNNNDAFEFRKSDSGIKIFNKVSGDYLVEVFTPDKGHNNGAFVKSSIALLPSEIFNSDFKIECVRYCKFFHDDEL
jgi:hypothetical protein